MNGPCALVKCDAARGGPNELTRCRNCVNRWEVESLGIFPRHAAVTIQLIQAIEPRRSWVLDNSGTLSVIVSPELAIVPPNERVTHEQAVRAQFPRGEIIRI